MVTTKETFCDICGALEKKEESFSELVAQNWGQPPPPRRIVEDICPKCLDKIKEAVKRGGF